MSAPANVMRWWWIRHAPVEARGFCGWSDPPADLSDEEAIGRLRSAMPEEATLVTSDLDRAIGTAEAIARRTWRRLDPQRDLREQNFGAWEGMLTTDVPAEEADAFWSDPGVRAPPGGESFSEVCGRVGEAIAAARAEAASATDVVAVAHAGTVRAALVLALGLNPSRALAFEVAPLSLTRIDWISEAGAWRVVSVNHDF
ncbi:MAG: histidine phosphatase family protein [Pseudomonadota bacterium]